MARWRRPPWRADRDPDFTRLWWASAVSDLGDGMTIGTGPLLSASLTDDPALVVWRPFAAATDLHRSTAAAP
ncbi:hypothetical protein ACFYOT_23855 [Saccharothrix saharensis]|uniref:hypothetical protein n=1 Tax=Saccharothrix saharensis TaxID=571190 RepID=UPI0036A35BB4